MRQAIIQAILVISIVLAHKLLYGCRTCFTAPGYLPIRKTIIYIPPIPLKNTPSAEKQLGVS